MHALTKGNIRVITETVDKAEISFSHLRDDLVDHICCEVEYQMQQGVNFQKAFAKIKRKIGIKDLQKVQEKTLLLIDKNYCAMKRMMKVSGIISTSLLMFGSLFKIQHWPGAGVLLISGFFILCFFFLPSANYMMHREKKDRSMIFLFISAFLGSFGFFLGLLFKIMHWPGANVLLTFGIGILAVLFLPALLVYLFKIAEEKKEKLIYCLGVFPGIIYLYGLLSKLMHWQGAALGLSIGSLCIIFIFIPSYTVYKYKNERYVKGSFLYLIAAISWFIMFSTLMSLTVSKSIIDSLFDMSFSTQKSISIIENQNEQMIEFSRKTDKYADLKKVSNLSNDLCNYIENIKIDIVKELGEENQDIINIENKVEVDKISEYFNYSAPFIVLIGEEQNGKAFELKAKIEKIRSQFISITKNDKNISILIEKLLNIKFPEGSYEWANSWEIFYFNHTTVIGSMNVLSSIQRNIRMAEHEILSFFMNQQNKELNILK